jgi:glutathione-regulated potassium-efflux system ancillary protein KefC
MDYLWIFAVFVSGLLFKLIQLPPLVGFLAAGFLMNAAGVAPIPAIDVIAEIGVILLLFTIGLKINLKNLFKPEILFGSSLQLLGCMVGGILLAKLFVIAGIYKFSGLSLLECFYISLALCFSSTVCAVKILEDKNELKTRHGQIALSILVIQDILAVIFLSLASGKWPTIWALVLFTLPFFRPLMSRLLEKAEHGEMLPLAGIFLALSGGELFHLFGVKADLGALIVGMLLSRDKKAAELSKSLMSFKDLFLVAFFLGIGFKALPTYESFMSALLLMSLLVVKALVFFFSMVVCRVRARTAFLATLALANFSEFGLIVAVVCEKYGWLSSDWVVIIAITVALSFIVTSVLNKKSHFLYTRLSQKIKPFQSHKCLDEDVFYQPKSAEILVIGMGRVGRGAYDTLEKFDKGVVWGIDANKPHIDRLVKLGYLVTVGDAEDVDFWNKVDLTHIRLVMLAMPSHEDMLEVIAQLKNIKYKGKTAGIAKHEDQRKELIVMGVDVAFNFYAEAGAGFAEESLHLLEHYAIK